jgi:long-chain fatty acid transport protein
MHASARDWRLRHEDVVSFASRALGAAFCLLAGQALLPPRVNASGFSTALFGGTHNTAADVGPTALYYNPGAIGFAQGQQLLLETVFALRHVGYERPASAIDPGTLSALDDAGLDRKAGTAALTGKGKLDALLLATPFLGGTTDLGMSDSPLRLSAAFFVPFGGQATFDRAPANKQFPGAVDGPARFYNISGQIVTYDVALGAAYRIAAARLSLGLSGNLYLSRVNTLRARNPDGTDKLVASDGSLLEGRSLLDVTGAHFGIGAGVLWEALAERLWLGASYQSQPGLGTMTMSGSLRNVFGRAPPEAPSDVRFTQALPDIARLGLRVRPVRDVELRLGLDLTLWSRLQQMCLAAAAVQDLQTACATKADGSRANPSAQPVIQVFQRRWRDALGAQASASYFVTSALELSGGAGFDGNAIPAATLDPALYDMNKLTFSGSGGYALSDHLRLMLTLTEVVCFARDTRDASGNDSFALPSRQPGNQGRYTQNVLLIDTGLALSF